MCIYIRLPPGGDGKITREEREKGRLLVYFAACVFGDSFGSFADGMLGQLSWQQKTNSGLDLPRGDGRSLVLVSQS